LKLKTYKRMKSEEFICNPIPGPKMETSGRGWHASQPEFTGQKFDEEDLQGLTGKTGNARNAVWVLSMVRSTWYLSTQCIHL